MSAFQYANGADGFCQDCGDETAEEWYALCMACYRIEQGWDEPDDDKPAADDLGRGLDRIDNVIPLREECPQCGETRVLFPSPADGCRVCLDCRTAHR